MNIVSIDFDIIMEPDINLYNNWVNDSCGIDKFVKDYSLLEYLKADLNIYEYLTRFLIKVIQKIGYENIFFIKDHNTLIKYTENKVFNLWNIDHHHDITYDEENIIAPILDPGCGNWIKYLMDYNKIKEYTWINNKNSISPNEEVLKYYKCQKYLLKEYNLNSLVEKIDKLFICQSPEWIPEYYLPLFDAWIAICEEYYGKPFKVI